MDAPASDTDTVTPQSAIVTTPLLLVATWHDGLFVVGETLHLAHSRGLCSYGGRVSAILGDLLPIYPEMIRS
jgi:hypothetical protein